MDRCPLCSVIVPVFEAPQADVEGCIRAILDQDYPQASCEIILVDDGSSLHPVAEQLARADIAEGAVTVIRAPHGGPAVARNAGLSVAQGDLVLFTDIDCLPERAWLSSYASAMAADDFDAAGGLTCSYVVETIAEQYADDFGSLRTPVIHGNALLLIACNACWRAGALRRLGGFHPAYRDWADRGLVFKGFEDFELSLRAVDAGLRLGFIGAAVVRHRHRRTIRDRLRQFASYGAGYAACRELRPGGAVGMTRYAVGPSAGASGLCGTLLREAAVLPARPFRREYDGLPVARRVAYPLFDYLQRAAFYYGFVAADRDLAAARSLASGLAAGIGETTAATTDVREALDPSLAGTHD